jgi:MFS family permease
MAAHVGARPAAAVWILTVTLITIAIATPIAGRLGDIFGRRRVLLLCLAATAAGGVLAATGGQMWVILAGRAIQGIGGGVMPLAISLVRDALPARRRASSIGFVSSLGGLGGGLGLPLGGWFVTHWSYEALFLALSVTAVAGLAAIVLAVPDNDVRRPARVDWAGAGLLGAAITLLLLSIARLASDWRDPVAVGAAAAGVASWVLLVLVESRARQPMISMPVLRRPAVALTDGSTFLLGFAQFAALLLIPQALSVPASSGWSPGASPAAAGLLILPGCALMVAASFWYGPVSRRIGNDRTLAAGLAATACGFAGVIGFSRDEVAVVAASSVLLVGIGVGFSATSNRIVGLIPHDQLGEAMGVNSLARVIGAAVGAQVSAAVLAAAGTGAGRQPERAGFTAAFSVDIAVVLVAAALPYLYRSGGARAGRPADRSAAGEPAQVTERQA